MKESIKKYIKSKYPNCKVTFGDVSIDPMTFKPIGSIYKDGKPYATYRPEEIIDEFNLNNGNIEFDKFLDLVKTMQRQTSQNEFYNKNSTDNENGGINI